MALGACLGHRRQQHVADGVLRSTSPAAAWQGTEMLRSVATYPISGALTLWSTPFCGQFN